MDRAPAAVADDPPSCPPALPEALDGYPLAALAEMCEVAESRTHALVLAKRLIRAWVAQLTRDIEAVKAPAPDALARARRRMIETRDSLLEAESMFPSPEIVEQAEPSGGIPDAAGAPGTVRSPTRR